MDDSEAPSTQVIFGLQSSLIDNSPDLIAVIDRQYSHQLVNSAYSKWYGKTAEEILGTSVAQLVGDEVFQNSMLPALELCFSGNPTRSHQRFNTRESGSRLLETRYYPLPSDGPTQHIVVLGREVAEETRLEDLKSSEEKYRALFESAREYFRGSPDAMYLHEVEESGLPGRILEVNDAGRRLFGFEEESLAIVRRNVIESMPPEQLRGIILQLATERRTTFEAAVDRKDGTKAIAEFTVRPFFWNGRMMALSVLRDVTERKRAQDHLKESEERYRILADFTYDWEHWLGPDGRYVYVSPSCERISGYRPEEFRADAHLIDKIAHPDDRARVVRHYWEEHKAGSESRQLDFRIIARDGSVRWINHVCQPIHGSDGTWLGWRASSRDVTEQRQAEQSLRASEERFRRVFEDGPIGMAIVGADHRFARANPAFCRMLGYSEEEVKALSVEEITHPHDLSASLAMIGRIRRGESPNPKTIVKRYIRKSGDIFWGRLTVATLHGQNTGSLQNLAMLEDISEQREADELREQYVSFVSHDLRAPLTVLIGQASLVRNRLAGKGLEAQVEGIEAILRNAWRMNDMIDDLLETSTLESDRWKIRRQATNLVQLVSDACDHSVSPEDRARLRMEQLADVPVVRVDQGKLERVIANLITNALKYSPPGSEVRLALKIADGEVSFSVSDQGDGIPSDEQKLVFERFYRAVSGKKSQGLGLGLYIARLIIDAHGGRIWVKSEVGTGSTFGFTLPVIE